MLGVMLADLPPPQTLMGPNEEQLVLQMGMWVSVEHGGISA